MKTDVALRHDVEWELQWDTSFDAKNIGEAVEHGVVTLTGDVRSYAEKLNVERAIERVSGVRGVANELQIRTLDEYNDTDIAKAAVDAIAWNTLVPAHRVVVEMERGWAILRGEVPHDYQRRAAERSVRNLRGVKGVNNRITLESRVQADDLEHKIAASLKRHAALDAKGVTVRVNDGDVTLRGIVRSRAERREAESTAWSGPGVTAVTNLITVNPVG
jgi:osmotically-inducible protein OsmY